MFSIGTVGVDANKAGLGLDSMLSNATNQAANIDRAVSGTYTESGLGGIGMLFKHTSLGAGDTTTFRYYVALDNRSMTDIIADLALVSGANLVDTTFRQVIDDIAAQASINLFTSGSLKLQPDTHLSYPGAFKTRFDGTTPPVLFDVMKRAPVSGARGAQAFKTSNIRYTPDVGNKSLKPISHEQVRNMLRNTDKRIADIYVPLHANSNMFIVNGGVTLPKGISQEYYIYDGAGE